MEISDSDVWPYITNIPSQVSNLSVSPFVSCTNTLGTPILQNHNHGTKCYAVPYH